MRAALLGATSFLVGLSAPPLATAALGAGLLRSSFTGNLASRGLDVPQAVVVYSGLSAAALAFGVCGWILLRGRHPWFARGMAVGGSLPLLAGAGVVAWSLARALPPAPRSVPELPASPESVR